MRLPELHFNLPDWNESDFERIKRAEKKIQDIERNGGQNSVHFQKACLRLRRLVLDGRSDRLSPAITSSIDVRAFTFLLGSKDDFVKHISLSRALLDQLLQPRNPMSKLSLLQLIRAYFVRYDTVATSHVLNHWQALIKYQLSQLNQSGSKSDLAAYAKYAEVLFSDTGPQEVVALAKDRQTDLDGILSMLGLSGIANGRFLDICRYRYYLETLEQIPVGSEHEVLSEIIKHDVVNAPFDDNQLLGHAVLEVLIDRSAGGAISDAWQSAILTIAGDPRVPKSSENYQKWWSLLGEQRVALMRGWLSRFDLSLFLKVLEQSARDGGNIDMERMFEPRKVFMEGLLNQELVIESRLFLSEHAENYLKSHFERSELPHYAHNLSGHTSMIYLNLGGRVHLVEGSHNFRLKLLDRLPSKTSVADYGIKLMEDSDLRKELIEQYKEEFDGSDGYRDLTHDIHLNWQRKAIDFLRIRGLKIDVAKVISKTRLREYKQKFGVD